MGCSKCDYKGYTRDPVLFRRNYCECIKAKVAADKAEADAFWKPVIANLIKTQKRVKHKKKVKYEIIYEGDARFVSKDDQLVTAHENSVWEDVWPDYSELNGTNLSSIK